MPIFATRNILIRIIYEKNISYHDRSFDDGIMHSHQSIPR